MTTAMVTSAPGKIVLSGEYAVLDGACGVAMAVNRRARVVLRPNDGACSEIVSPSFSDVSAQCDITASPPLWHHGLERYSIVDAVLKNLAEPPPFNGVIHLDSSAFADAGAGAKLGIGSSAALCVALTLSLSGHVDIKAVAHAAHRDFQNGLGSGIDIACSLRGGLIAYRKQGAESTSLQWPQQLCYRVLWSGAAADTSKKIAKMNNAQRTDCTSRQRLFAVANRMAERWQSGDAAAVLDGYMEYLVALQQFDDDYALGIFAAGHAQLLHAARETGLIYKPCGAGGGDVGILLGVDEQKLDDFVARRCGDFKRVDCVLDDIGATVENGVERNNG